MPTVWFRNTRSWGRKEEKPELKVLAAGKDVRAIAARQHLLGERFLYCEGAVDLLFTENETNTQRAFNEPNQQPYCKDGIIQAVVHGNKNAINPELRGTKGSAHYRFTVPAKGSQTVRLRLTDQPPDRLQTPFGKAFAAQFKARQAEADAFYESITPAATFVNIRNSWGILPDRSAALPQQSSCIKSDSGEPMRTTFVVGLIVLILGVASLFIAIPQREKHGVKIGDASVGVETTTSRKVAPAVSAVLIAGGAALVIVGRRRTQA